MALHEIVVAASAFGYDESGRNVHGNQIIIILYNIIYNNDYRL